MDGVIGPEGIGKLCEELAVEMEDPVLIALSFVMSATTLGWYVSLTLSGLV